MNISNYIIILIQSVLLTSAVSNYVQLLADSINYMCRLVIPIFKLDTRECLSLLCVFLDVQL